MEGLLYQSEASLQNQLLGALSCENLGVGPQIRPSGEYHSVDARHCVASTCSSVAEVRSKWSAPRYPILIAVERPNQWSHVMPGGSPIDAVLLSYHGGLRPFDSSYRCWMKTQEAH